MSVRVTAGLPRNWVVVVTHGGDSSEEGGSVLVWYLPARLQSAEPC